jgi:hypothetical protein
MKVRGAAGPYRAIWLQQESKVEGVPLVKKESVYMKSYKLAKTVRVYNYKTQAGARPTVL